MRPFFKESTVKGVRYCQIITDFLLDEINGTDLIDISLQQDGATSQCGS